MSQSEAIELAKLVAQCQLNNKSKSRMSMGILDCGPIV